ncbi:MAG TPA: rhodanese-like domain-containing protein [Mycobacteriales bacterium]
MIVEQFYLGCLSQASYLVADEVSGRALVVDPRRDIDDYLTYATEHGLRIELVVLTHVHADFVPGYAELAAATGGEVAMGELSPVEFPIRRLADREWLHLGDERTGVAVEVLATPGHTPESITLAVYERAADPAPAALLTGDTLFIGDVGRPDLLGAAGRSAEDMARQLYASLHQRILPLPDEVLVYPGHGAGSACGKALSEQTFSTLGEQRRSNYALAPMQPDEFVRVVTRGLGEPPAYFSQEVALNRSGHDVLPSDPLPVLDVDEALARVARGTLLLDVRDDQAFAAGALRGSVNVGLSGRFAEFAAAVHVPGQQIVLAGSAEEVAEARLRLARVGLDEVVAAVLNPAEHLLDRSGAAVVASRLTAGQARDLLAGGADIQVVDVRSPTEHADGALPGAVNLPLPRLLDALDRIDPERPVLVHCAGGYRSSAAASLLRARGFHDVSDLLGGYAAWAPFASSMS